MSSQPYTPDPLTPPLSYTQPKGCRTGRCKYRNNTQQTCNILHGTQTFTKLGGTHKPGSYSPSDMKTDTGKWKRILNRQEMGWREGMYASMVGEKGRHF